MAFVTVLVTVCLNLAQPSSCVTEPVVDSNQDNVTMAGCMSLEGFLSAKQWWEQHPLYKTWQFKGWGCKIGNKTDPVRHKGEA